ncbi:hypothetical protein H6P81_009225 [Aristolochia fimbriata]|uniref:Uncharacterized protein n=1 Tax=Aristolochia fimbriata TaxID=158543 RepID=A0AAV7EMD1_ARIFI|nr:hypothetical protein H6P81_009225 [Aristolochia fimbriata]
MATSKLLILAVVVFALVFNRIAADAGIGDEDVAIERADPALAIELEQLKSKVSVLESSVDEKIRELKSKDERISQMEKIVQEKKGGVAALEREIKSLKEKGSVAAEEQVVRAHARAGELEKQVETLKKDIEMQSKIKAAWEGRTTEAESKVQELTAKLESLQKINNEQKNRIRKTERALQLAEEEIMNAKLEAASKKNELIEVHGAWLPPWLASHLIQSQSFAARNWNVYGKPLADAAVQKASEKSAQAKKWAEPHIETLKTKLIPFLREKWIIVSTTAGPYVQSATSKTIELYETSKVTLTPHVVKVKETATPYLQEAKRISKPYIDQVATSAKPHVDRVRVISKPYTDKVVHVSGKFLKSATTYHHKVQANVQEKLERHELTKPLATTELVWFVASAVLALPIFVLYKMLTGALCSKSAKPGRNSHGNHGHRRPKRRHADK